MAGRLNHLFQVAPQQFLERTVVFTDGLLSAPRNKLTHFLDLEPSGRHARARVFEGQHLYEDTALRTYIHQPGGVTLLPREDPPQKFVFLPEFTACRLLISMDGPDLLKLQTEENLNGRVPPPDPAKFVDSFAYWDHTTGHLVGVIRATAVMVKQPEEPWTIIMQQIVGTAGHELVRQVFVHTIS